jgi:replicative DNA helicase
VDALTRRAERALLGAMIAAPWLPAWMRVRPQEFGDPGHRTTFLAILSAQQEAGRSRDTQEWRAAILRSEPAATPAGLDALVQACPSPRHAIAYVGLVVHAWAARAVGEAAETILARARLLESDSRQVMRVATAEGLEATTAARHMADVATTMHAHVSALGRTPSSLGPVPDSSRPEQARREEAVLAGFLLQPPGHARQILAILDDRDIGDPYRRAMIRALRDMHASGMAVDELTLDWELAQRGLPLVRQPEEVKGRETYAMRLARHGVDEGLPIQAARELAAERTLRSQQAQRPNHSTGQRPERTMRRQPQAGRTGHPSLRLIPRPPENGGPQHGPQQGR